MMAVLLAAGMVESDLAALLATSDFADCQACGAELQALLDDVGGAYVPPVQAGTEESFWIEEAWVGASPNQPPEALRVVATLRAQLRSSALSRVLEDAAVMLELTSGRIETTEQPAVEALMQRLRHGSVKKAIFKNRHLGLTEKLVRSTAPALAKFEPRADSTWAEMRTDLLAHLASKLDGAATAVTKGKAKKAKVGVGVGPFLADKFVLHHLMHSGNGGVGGVGVVDDATVMGPGSRCTVFNLRRLLNGHAFKPFYMVSENEVASDGLNGLDLAAVHAAFAKTCRVAMTAYWQERRSLLPVETDVLRCIDGYMLSGWLAGNDGDRFDNGAELPSVTSESALCEIARRRARALAYVRGSEKRRPRGLFKTGRADYYHADRRRRRSTARLRRLVSRRGVILMERLGDLIQT